MTGARWTLSRRASSAREARAAVRGFLADIPSTPADTDAVALVASELVSNAVLHTSDLSETIELRIDEGFGAIHIEVQDHDPTPPAPRFDALDAEGGRGLVIVDHLASRWGWDEIAGDGKQVWCDVPTRRRPSA